MTATNEAWISDSLARLEQLEAQREQLAAAGRTDALAELEEEIKSLYEVLESAAEEDAAANTSPAPQMHVAPMQAAPVQAPYSAPPQMQMQPQYSAPVAEPAPFAPPAMTPPFSPPAMQAPPAMAPSFDGGSASYDDDVSPGGGKGLVIGIAAVVVIGLGVGGWFMFGRSEPAPAAPAPSGPATVIQAGAIPDDTQDPNVAKGGDASRTPEVVIKEAAPRPEERRPTSGPRPSSGPSSKPTRDDKPSGRSDSINIDKSNDPLAGVR